MHLLDCSWILAERQNPTTYLGAQKEQHSIQPSKCKIVQTENNWYFCHGTINKQMKQVQTKNNWIYDCQFEFINHNHMTIFKFNVCYHGSIYIIIAYYIHQPFNPEIRKYLEYFT